MIDVGEQLQSAYDDGFKAGIEVLQEIRQEIESYCRDGGYYMNTLGIALEIIDKHIKQIEGSDTE